MPAQNTVKIVFQMRNDTAANWASKNPVLLMGEYGLENDTNLIKVGDGATNWINLPYLNKLDGSFFTHNEDGSLSFDTSFLDSVITTDGGKTITGSLALTSAPVAANDVANKEYVDTAIVNAGHLKRAIVDELPLVEDADPDTIYMIKDDTAINDMYREYMLIDNELVQTGDTSIDLTKLVSGTPTTGNLIMVGEDGALVDSGLLAADIGKLNPATSTVLGGVLSSTDDNYIQVENDGKMKLNRVSTSLLYVPSGDELILDGGNA